MAADNGEEMLSGDSCGEGMDPVGVDVGLTASADGRGRLVTSTPRLQCLLSVTVARGGVGSIVEIVEG